MLECCISGGGAGLGNLYILTVVVMIEDSNTSDDIRVDSGFHLASSSSSFSFQKKKNKREKRFSLGCKLPSSEQIVPRQQLQEGILSLSLLDEHPAVE